ncbi:hypothetical protein ACJX0J_010424, partial [Zea mays]
FSLTRNILSITLDNASSNTKAIDNLTPKFLIVNYYFILELLKVTMLLRFIIFKHNLLIDQRHNKIDWHLEKKNDGLPIKIWLSSTHIIYCVFAQKLDSSISTHASLVLILDASIALGGDLDLQRMFFMGTIVVLIGDSIFPFFLCITPVTFSWLAAGGAL